ncbi:Kinesin heavy chain,Kinesin-like protein KIN-14Q,Kinesin-like protein KIN-14S,Kinesin-like protein KIF17,Kinesin-like protein KIN-14E,Kinesin-like protein KIN-14D,Kinesin-II 85 kDa subunit,Kinesin-like protein KIN-14F,Carboxy-terminal kinesin 2,Kinesin-like protein KIN-14H,Kinesin-like protein KIN-14A,Kinesin-1 heavy chain,Kinesin-like protein 3,Kinesin-like protein KIF13B,Kinesin-like protein KIN-14L,Kinesin-related protein 7,Kinesin-like protein KIN-14R,Kinesin-like protein KIN-14I,Kinesin-like protein K|uniref:Kinesin-like protein n=1 Tax=Mytilus edulis TaxID=6550 RepID=A0A8S3SUY8_MYTED|nr:Kinesin heavy chain,Kinesin-like protein KIN-14Q,Kinesin-like protein KIN-14S,Kinesin-like protein KIF17,Kinesin-like protein KIN-14E,Kinesin-like protein KIN-14D,Kinesin-II 85 kDa subunit,Kinesin-like protein KIN-14F,Carboxy-terminal kinesin 2,Kinesin-like protein KIN-14H,Kinesin-like protein KIN-14A,Kinesin-1 heavy chain,Kinesin-like protein 3,Kinesin-like protein KIF13B,Kinesin-like protein KIN-14L,Kinesin-related protein 7,Kinesin-like protein KIN-14R,Kinesin-like protein KIN-14I,Kinesin-lik
MSVMKDEVDNQKSEIQTKLANDKKLLDAELKVKDQEIAKLTSRNDELEKARLANVPLDTAKEIQNLQAKLALLEKDKNKSGTETTALQGQISELKVKLENANKNLETQRATARETEVCKLFTVLCLLSDVVKAYLTLERKIKELETVKPLGKGVAVAAGKQRGQHQDKTSRARTEERRRTTWNSAAGGDDKNLQKRHEKILKELERKLEIEKSKTEKLQESLKGTEDDLKDTKKDRDNKANELRKLEAELAALGVAAKEGVEAASKVKNLEKETKVLNEENKVLTENYNTERVLRKKYYNMVEDMKGKIRVYCRARPLSKTELGRGNRSVLKSQDEYSITVETQRGIKDFQFDQIFMEDSTQEKIFEDTNNLVQSAVDGYNVCIFAYGQTGSGKTFTMIGDKDQNFPGIAPRAFNRIFDLINELKSKSDITVTAYMMELYNDKLIDLFAKPGHSSDDKMDIKVDKKGLVWVKGAVIKEAHNSKELFALFQEGSEHRHTASTKMNDESSRSHLIISLVLETTNKMTGQTAKGKLSLVDLAGSERVGKTGASADQLKEAMSINKSLSALGDVISALSSEQQFIPYRNNKLTMLMQDSLGGNAKTLMFVNISPADYNQDESVISLTYASRVKLITNQASKNSDNKEIARLKSIIAKLKAGEAVDDEDVQ